jgi:hypothetical protein
MSVVRPVRPWDYNQQGLQKLQTALSRDAGLEQKLREFMRSGEDWERSGISTPGVFVVKLLGAGQGSGAHAGDKIPSTARASPGRGEGTMVRENSRILYDQWLVKLVEILEAVNPKAVKSNSRLIEVWSKHNFDI